MRSARARTGATVGIIAVAMLAACSGNEPADTQPEVRDEVPADALFETTGDVDGDGSLDAVWVDRENMLHAGPWSIAVDVPNASPIFVAEETRLEVVEANDGPLIVFVHPTEGSEDPPNLVQLFTVDATGLHLVYQATLDQASELEISDTGVSYVESRTDACLRVMQGDAQPRLAPVQEVFIEPGQDGAWEETRRADTGAAFDCANLAG